MHVLCGSYHILHVSLRLDLRVTLCLVWGGLSLFFCTTYTMLGNFSTPSACI